MKIDEIKIGNIYYYNNRPVMVLGIELNGSIRVSGDFDLMTEVSGEQWCYQCMVGGGDYKGGHTCEDAQEIIDGVLDDISGTEVFWVHSAEYLKEKPFEWEENEKLKQEIKEKKDRLEHLKNLIILRGEDLDALNKGINEKYNVSEELRNKIVKHEEELDSLQKAIFFYKDKKELIEEKIVPCNKDSKPVLPLLPIVLETMSIGDDGTQESWDEGVENVLFGVRYFFHKDESQHETMFDGKYVWEYNVYHLMMENKDGEVVDSNHLLQETVRIYCNEHVERTTQWL